MRGINQWGQRQGLQSAEHSEKKILQQTTKTLSTLGRQSQWQHVSLELQQLQGVADTFVCNAAMIAYCKGLQWKRALKILDDMRQQDIQQNVVSYSAVLGACSKAAHWQSALQLLRQMLGIADLVADVRSYSDVVRASAKGLQWTLALVLLREMEKERCLPDLITFSGAVSEQTPWPHALALLHHMERVAVLPNAVTFSCIMRTFQRSDQWVLASQLFVQMKDADVLPDVVAYSAAISASASGAQWTEALTLCMELQAMKKRGLSADVICYNALIQACGEGQQWRLALWAFAEIQLNRLQPTQISFNTAISACSRCGEWQSALVLFDILSQLEGQHQIGVDALACNAVLSALEKHGLWKMGLDFLKKMQSQHKVQPDVITYNTLISSCGRRGNWQEALALLAALTHELQADEISFSAAISACGHGLHWLQSLQLLGQMEREDVAGVASGACAGRSVTGITAFGAAITACEELGLWEQSLLLLARAQAARAVNVVVLNAAISACGKGRQWQRALSLLFDADLSSNVIGYNSVLAAGQLEMEWEVVLNLLHFMRQQKLHADAIGLSAGIGSCVLGGVPQTAQALLSLLQVKTSSTICAHLRDKHVSSPVNHLQKPSKA